MVPIICVLDCNYLKNVLLLQIYTPWPVVIQISQVSVFFFSNLPAYNYMRGRSGKSKFFIWSTENNFTYQSDLQVPI